MVAVHFSLAEQTVMSIYQPTARNYAQESENKMHSDEIAKQFGFDGALVAGVAVFGHMTYPLVNTLGADWLTGYSASIRLFKPAYHGDVLNIEHSETNGQHLVRCSARGDVVLAELRSEMKLPPVSELSLQPGGAPVEDRGVVTWDEIHENEAFPSFKWTPTSEENETFTTQIDDPLALYVSGIVHPHLVLSQANRAFSHRFVLPAWIHVGSEILFRELLRVGDEVEIHTVPARKWRQKGRENGHEFVELHIAYRVGDRVVTEIKHTAIFNVAAQAA